MFDYTAVEDAEFVTGGAGLEAVEVVVPAVVDKPGVKGTDEVDEFPEDVDTDEGYGMKTGGTDKLGALVVLFRVADKSEDGGGDNAELGVDGGFVVEAVESTYRLQYCIVVHRKHVFIRAQFHALIHRTGEDKRLKGAIQSDYPVVCTGTLHATGAVVIVHDDSIPIAGLLGFKGFETHT